MAEVASRELRNNTRGLLRRVEAGEDVVLTVAGRPVAVLRPVSSQARWMRRHEFIRRYASRQADPAMAKVRHELAPDTTDDLR